MSERAALCALPPKIEGMLWQKLWLVPLGRGDSSEYPSLLSAARELVARVEFDWDESYSEAGSLSEPLRG